MMALWTLAMVALAQPEAGGETDPDSGVEGALDSEPAEPAEPADTDDPAEAEPIEAEPEYAVLWPGQCTAEDPHYDLEVLYHLREYDAGLTAASAALVSAPDDVTLMWMKARFMYEIGERDADIDKESHYEAMLVIADAGLALEPDNLHLRFGRGVAMGRLGTTRGVLSSLFMADDIEADWLAVANANWRYSSIGGEEVLPCDAVYALGIFYRLVPDWWIVKVLSGTRGDLDKSVAFHERSIACKPHEMKNYKELGASQLCLAARDKDDALHTAALATLSTGLTKKVRYARDAVDKKHIQMLIDDPDKACEYSRDGQQDLDRKKLDN